MPQSCAGVELKNWFLHEQVGERGTHRPLETRGIFSPSLTQTGDEHVSSSPHFPLHSCRADPSRAPLCFSLRQDFSPDFARGRI